MNTGIDRSRRGFAIGLAAAALSSRVPAQPAPVEMRVELVKTGLYLISGGGCNSLLRLSAAGCILVDGKQPGTYRALMAQIRRINKLSDLPVRVAIFTNHHDIHAGNTAQFVDAGMAVIAQQNALPRLPPAKESSLAASASARRRTGAVFGFRQRHDFRMGGVEVQLHDVGPAQTNGDIVVLFPDLKVLALGELYSADEPVPDFRSDGSLAGWGPALNRVLELDFDMAVPSVGSPVGKAELASYRDRVESLTSRAAALVKAAVPQDRFLQHLRTVDLGWTMHLDAESIGHLYADLARGI